MTLSARPTFSASTRKTSCSIADGWMPRAYSPWRMRADLFEAMKQIAETGHGPLGANPLNGMFDQMEGLRVLNRWSG